MNNKQNSSVNFLVRAKLGIRLRRRKNAQLYKNPEIPQGCLITIKFCPKDGRLLPSILTKSGAIVDSVNITGNVYNIKTSAKSHNKKKCLP